MCPKCYNSGKDEEPGVACYQCVSRECEWSAVNNNLGHCSMCEVGLLVLDPPQSNLYSLSCNECVNHYKITAKA